MKDLSALIPHAAGGLPARAAEEPPGKALAMPRGEAREVLDKPPSPLLASSLAAVYGNRCVVENGVARFVRVPMPAGPETVAGEARERLAAVRAMLAPASMALRMKWVLAFASSVEKSPDGDALDTAAQLLAGMLELPPCCFVAPVEPREGEDAAARRSRGMVERVREVARQRRFWSTFAVLEPILAPYADGLRSQEARLAALLDLIEPKPAAPKAIAGPAREPEPEDDPAAYLSGLEADYAIGPAGSTLSRARFFRNSLRRRGSPALRDPAFAARLDAVCGMPDGSTAHDRAVAMGEARPVPALRPDGSMARMLAEQHARRRATAAAAAGPALTDDQLRAMTARQAALVDLSTPAPRTSQPGETVRRDAETAPV